jgi:DNA-binding NarL/FixJ family response regulator
VLRLVARGLTNKEVANKLEISARTVGHHLAHTYEKIGVTTRAGAAMFAMKNGIVGAV